MALHAVPADVKGPMHGLGRLRMPLRSAPGRRGSRYHPASPLPRGSGLVSWAAPSSALSR